jgi:hypothetical protein
MRRLFRRVPMKWVLRVLFVVVICQVVLQYLQLTPRSVPRGVPCQSSPLQISNKCHRLFVSRYRPAIPPLGAVQAQAYPNPSPPACLLGGVQVIGADPAVAVYTVRPAQRARRVPPVGPVVQLERSTRGGLRWGGRGHGGIRSHHKVPILTNLSCKAQLFMQTYVKLDRRALENEHWKITKRAFTLMSRCTNPICQVSPTLTLCSLWCPFPPAGRRWARG